MLTDNNPFLRLTPQFGIRSVEYIPEMFPLLQPAPALLGEPDQEPELCVRHPQVAHRGRVPVGGGADLHGRLLHLRPPPRQGLPLLQAALRQGHPRLQGLGGEVRTPTPLALHSLYCVQCC